MIALVAGLIFIGFIALLVVSNKGYSVKYNESGSHRNIKVTADPKDLERLCKTFKGQISPEKGTRNPPHMHLPLGGSRGH